MLPARRLSQICLSYASVPKSEDLASELESMNELTRDGGERG
jgi:hypothetical protein